MDKTLLTHRIEDIRQSGAMDEKMAEPGFYLGVAGEGAAVLGFDATAAFTPCRCNQAQIRLKCLTI